MMLAASLLLAIAGGVSADCPSAPSISGPRAACKLGQAVLSVPAVDGATYAWIADGATIVSGNGTNQIVLALGSGTSVKVVAAVGSPQCSGTAEMTIALRDRFSIKSLSSAGSVALEPTTIAWSYVNGEPATQVLTGTDFPDPVTVPKGQHSYTYTPLSEGAKDVVLTANGAPPPPAGRSRATASGGGSASGCLADHTSAKYVVQHCVAPDAGVASPSRVAVDGTFTASVRPQDYATYAWTITNGSPATASGPAVLVRAGKNGDKVGLSVSVTRGTCTSTNSRDVQIVPSLDCDEPTATVTAGSDASCSTGGQVKVAFTGTPPFRGLWWDGVAFTTSESTIARKASAPGSYSIGQFSDAYCSGVVTGAAKWTTFGPTVTLDSSSLCGSAVITAHFNGKPPFSGTWSDGTPFSGVTGTLTRNVGPGDYAIRDVFDVTGCAGVMTSQPVSVRTLPTVAISAYNTCVDGNAAAGGLKATFTNALSPLTVNWSDGQKSTSGAPFSDSVTHTVPAGTYTIVSASDASCSASILPGSATILRGAMPQIAYNGSPICPGTRTSASLYNSIPPGSTISWTLTGGTIVSGQGTPYLQFDSGGSETYTLSATIAVPNGCPMTSQVPLHSRVIPLPPHVSGLLSIRETTTTSFYITPDWANTISWKVLPNSKGDEMVSPYGCSYGANGCSFTYRNTTGPGTSNIPIHFTGCDGVEREYVWVLQIKGYGE